MIRAGSPNTPLAVAVAGGTGTEEEYYDEEGAHDTITSLAGVQMLQKYRRTISGGGNPCSRRHSLSSQRLENLFQEHTSIYQISRGVGAQNIYMNFLKKCQTLIFQKKLMHTPVVKIKLLIKLP